MRVLIETKIFPNDRDPLAAPYNRHQFEALARLCTVNLHATVPWFPGGGLLSRLRGREMQALPTRAQMGELEIAYRRVLYLPRVGRALSGLTYAGSLWPGIRKVRGSVDVVLAAFAYPDGFAGALLARALGVPFVLKVHGSDINVLPTLRGLKPQIQWTLRQAHAVFGPSRPLIDRAVELGANPERARVVFNGINRALFCVRDREDAKRKLGLSTLRHQLLFVGRPERAKGFDELIAAMVALKDETPPVELIVVGDASEAGKYRALAEQSGAAISFVGTLAQQRIADYLAACDALVLPSWAEGTPNVILEALASGRRVVATSVGGIPDIVNRPEYGILIEPRNADSLAVALRRVVSEFYDPQSISDSLTFGDWVQSARNVLGILEEAVGHSGPSGGGVS